MNPFNAQEREVRVESPQWPSECDVVMKGGITSGVIYPLVVCELAKRFRFRNIGGTSAGAIAAVATAAAEYGKRKGQGTGFAGLEGLNAWLSGKGRLVGMFQPSRTTRPLFRLLIASLRATSLPAKTLAALAVLVGSFPIASALGATPGAALALVMLLSGAGWGVTVLGVGNGILLIVLGSIAAAALACARRALSALPQNGYGICTGLDPAGTSVERPLTNWLAHLINTLAGKPDEQPLTFGDLWTVDGESDLAMLRESPAHRGINLEVVTTNLSHGRPYRVPIERYKTFYYDPREWRTLFPEPVMAWMDGHARPVEPHDPSVRAEGVATLHRLPAPEDLPLVVAARMSLSFPVLLSAVPLYNVDFTLAENIEARKQGKAVRAERCWFSDGGICSNFPIHFFDEPLPRRPTFGINLKEFHPDHAPHDPSVQSMDQVEPYAVWTPQDNNSGWRESWTRFDRGSGVEWIAGFASAIRNAMQNWRDTTLSRMPGYRDRIVHISQASWEGGLNLDMPADVITRLGERGRRAGRLLVERDPSWWVEHRWVRYRSVMGLIENFLAHYEQGHDHPTLPMLADLIARPQAEPPDAYRWPDGSHREAAKVMTDALITLCRTWTSYRGTFQNGAPRPEPAIHVGPKF